MRTNGDSEVTCEVCGHSEARTRYVTRSFGHGDNLLIIENVPMVSCPRCGESYFTADTLHEIERIKRNRHVVAVERVVPVAEFAR
jgi:YgiT-type zinc finger domain-containing protein